MLTKDAVKKVHADINAALEQVAKKHGLVLSKVSKIRFDATTFTYTGQFGEEGVAGDVDPKLVANANRYGAMYGFGALGSTITHPRLGQATYVGMSTRNKAVLKASDGKMYTIKAPDLARMWA